MKVDETKPVEASAQVARHGKQVAAGEHEARQGLAPEHPSGEAGAPAETDVPEDIAAFHGLSGGDLTDRARIAMMQLIAEIAELRQELTRNRMRMDYLSDLADRDPLSTVLNRRAFVRELSHAQLLGREYRAENTLVFLTVDNLKEVNERHGHAAGDAAIEHVAEILRQRAGEADVVGRLGGAEFAVVLVGSGIDGAVERARWLGRLIEARLLVWKGERIAFRIGFAVHPMRADEAAEEALGTADRDRLEAPGSQV